MFVVVFLIAIALILFWFTSFGVAVAGSVVIALLLAAKLHDAMGRGRRVIAQRGDDGNDSSMQPEHHRHTMLHTLWIGLTVAGTAHHHDAGSHVHCQHGDFGGGGFGDGGGGDAGGI